MNSTEHNDVLIVGAGPTGMVLAIELARRGVRFRMIDKRKGPSATSRSFTLHAKTLEMFEHMGIARRFLEDGMESRGFYFNFKGKDAHPTLDFSELDSPYQYILVYNQNQTESRLREHLDHSYDIRAEWSTELTDLVATEGGHNAVLQRADGTAETITPTWVVGCDGVHSFVRGAADLEFSGENYDGMIMQMMDVKFDGFEGGDDWVHYYMSKQNFLLLTRLPNGNHRVLISDMGEADDPTRTTRESFQELVDGHVEGTQINEPDWATKWEIWKRIASDYVNGNIFLAGDAAHVHSPSGGQGMNAGMQDAFNLGWKLAYAVRGQAKRALLDTYVPERKPIGEQVIAGTDAMHDIIMAHGMGMEDRLQLTQQPGWHEQTVARISGLSYNYRDATEVPEDLAVPEGEPIGNRAPDVPLSTETRLFDVLRHPRVTLLIAPGSKSDPQFVGSLTQDIGRRFDAMVKCAVICAAGLSESYPDAEVDETGEFAARYGAADEGHVYVIRPDGYVAMHCSLSDASFATGLLDDWFVGAAH